MSRRIVITVDLTEEATEDHASQLAEAITSGLQYYDPEEYEGGDLREYVEDYDYTIEEED